MNVQKLINLDACHEAVQWARTQPNWETLWNNCERGDWMLWLIGKTIAGEPMSNERKPLVLAACDCAELALKYVKKGEKRPKEAIETARKWATGDSSVSEQDMINASYAAAAAGYASVHASVHASYAASYAGYAGYAAYSDAASYAGYAADYANDAAKEDILKQSANLVRKHYPYCPIK